MAGQIPLIESERSIQNVGGIDVYANPDQFGAGIGREIEGLGRSIIGISGQLKSKEEEEKNRKRAASLATNVTNASIAYAKTAQELQVNAPEDGKGTTDNTLAAQRGVMEEYAEKISDPVERMAFRKEMEGRLVPYATSNVEFEANRTASMQQKATDYALNGLQNLVRTDAMQYDQAVTDSGRMIDTQVTDKAQAAQMKRNMSQKLAYSRFQGLMEDAKTPQDFDAISKDLVAKDSKWQALFDPQQLESTLNEIATAKKTFVTQADVTARAAIDSAEARNKDLVQIDPAEITQLTEMADLSGNPITMKRARRLERDQQMLVHGSKLPAAELKARSNEKIQGGYPGMPDEINKGIAEAVTLFPGVSSSFLGGLTQEEYGVYLPKQRTRKGDDKFAPKPVHGGVDVRNMQPAAYNATLLAGEIYGEPLQLVSGHRSQTKQNSLRNAPGKDPSRRSIAGYSRHTEGDAVDVLTTGMTGAQKAKLVNAMLQAGFTGFGEYGDHIHADMRETTPNSFNAETGWLGWSKGSPEVVAELVARGYGPGISGKGIVRGSAAAAANPPVDFGKGTIGDTTSATGVNQWTAGSFLEKVKDPNIAQRINAPKGWSDAQLLELRKDPKFSLKVTAAYAEQNQKTMTRALGRPVNDAELYMAHFLGPTGAMTLISAYNNSPEKIAAEIMPRAAKNNPPRFYENIGKPGGGFVQGPPKSVKDTYDDISVKFGTAPGQVQYEDAKQYERMAEAAKKGQDTDPMTHYNNNVAPVNDLNAEGGYAARGATALAAANLYQLPTSEMKPFTVDEAAELTKKLSEGTAEEKLAVMQNVETMDQSAPGMGAAAFAQLGQKDTALSHAASLSNERGDAATAEMIIRGQQRLKDDKQFEGALFADKVATSDAFNAATDGSLLSLTPQARGAIFDAAKALYAEQAARAGSYTFDPDAFKTAVTQVVGGANSTPGLAEVNGKMTMLPPGVTGEIFDSAINNMTDSDLIEFSADGAPPVNIEGDPITAAEIAQEGEFVYIGGTSYLIRMNDHNMLTTGQRLGNGTLQAFVFEAEPNILKTLAYRTAQAGIGLNAIAPPGKIRDDGSSWNLPPGAGETAPVPGWGN